MDPNMQMLVQYDPQLLIIDGYDDPFKNGVCKKTLEFGFNSQTILNQWMTKNDWKISPQLNGLRPDLQVEALKYTVTDCDGNEEKRIWGKIWDFIVFVLLLLCCVCAFCIASVFYCVRQSNKRNRHYTEQTLMP